MASISQDYRPGKQRELQRRGIPPNTVVTPDNYQLLLTKDSLLSISNNVSKIWKRKLTTGDVNQLFDFMTKLPPTRFYKLTFREAHTAFAKEFTLRFDVAKAQIDPEQDVAIIIDDLDDTSLHGYQKSELNQLTNNENPIKLINYADRRGNAVIDREKVAGKRSSPHNLPSGKVISKEELDGNTYSTMKMIQDFLAPESIDKMLGKINSMYTTFQSVNLPHQTVPLDSRNRLITNNSEFDYKWNVHTAGVPGHLGDIRIQDTLQQVIKMKICPFWLPIVEPVDTYYGKIHVLIKEFISQSIQINEFLGVGYNDPNVSYYHFELEIRDQSGDRIYLVPVCDTFTFRRPFAQVNTLTICFRTPFALLPLLADRGIFTITYGNPTLFTITSAATHGLSTGDLIYILNSDSGDTTIDNLLTQQNGYFITVTGLDTFTIPLDTSAIPGSDTNISIYYGSKRIYIQLEFVSLEQ